MWRRRYRIHIAAAGRPVRTHDTHTETETGVNTHDAHDVSQGVTRMFPCSWEHVNIFKIDATRRISE